MRRSFIRSFIDYDLTYADVRTTSYEDYAWERMYRKARKALPPGPWRFYETKKHAPDRPAYELRLEARWI